MASGKKVVLAALIGNGLIAIIKFIASFITGSSAMLSEAIHSTVDTSNQSLLLHGMAKSKKPADTKHPFGYGMELYFWAFIVAVLIFAVGAGVSIYEGIHKIMEPQVITSAIINYIVLGLAIIFESIAFAIALKEFNRRRGKASFINAIKRSKNPAIFTVLLEDFAALLGLIVALVGIILADIFGLLIMDGVASVVIGIILALTAIALVVETKGLLLGEAADEGTNDKIKEIISRNGHIDNINQCITMHMGAEDILLNISLDFNEELSANDVEKLTAKIDNDIKSELPNIKRIFIEARGCKDM